MVPPKPTAPSVSSDISEDVGTTLLALPDGPIPASHPDRSSHTSSFIGGYPTFPALPVAGSSRGPGTVAGGAAAKSSRSSASGSIVGEAPSVVNCGSCHNPAPLLAQIYCPLDGGENDRTLYVWGCARAKCRRREGSVRAFRASVRNEVYVADVEAKRAEKERREAEEKEKARVNPFTVTAATTGGLFGAQPLFGAAATNPFAAPAPAPVATSTPTPAPATPATVIPTEPLASLSLSSAVTFTPPLPAYQPPQYLATIDEYLPLPDDDVDDDDDDDDDDDETPEQSAEWRDEGWEKLLPRGVDDVFERFVRRLESAEDGTSQVLRYDFDAVPLPYSSSSPLFKKLFPGCPTRAPTSEEEETVFSTYYDDSWVPKCARCKGKRVFELQLVPQLITALRPQTLSTTGEVVPIPTPSATVVSEEERRKELEKLAKGETDGEVDEMEWGTVMVFACERDCVGVGEEWVGVEWEGVPGQ